MIPADLFTATISAKLLTYNLQYIHFNTSTLAGRLFADIGRQWILFLTP